MGLTEVKKYIRDREMNKITNAYKHTLFISFLIFVFQQIGLQQSPYGKLYQL
jgi:hypothetical protein